MMALLEETMTVDDQIVQVIAKFDKIWKVKKSEEIVRLFKAMGPVTLRLRNFNASRSDTLLTNIDMELVRLRNRLEVVAGGKDDRNTWDAGKRNSKDTVSTTKFINTLKELEKTIRKQDMLTRGTALKQDSFDYDSCDCYYD